MLFGWQYAPVALGFVLSLFAIIATDRPQNRWPDETRVLAEVLALTMAAVVLVPSSYRSAPQSTWVGLFAERLSLWCAVLLLAVLATARRRWYFVAGFLSAAYFFGLLHADLRKVARMEATIESLVGTLSQEQRVVAYVPDLGSERTPALIDTVTNGLAAVARRLPGLRTLARHRPLRISLTHLLARACIGRCFDYMNHEPSTDQFRIHAMPGNPVVAATITDVYAMEQGIYVMKAADPSLYAIFRCGPGTTDLCLRALQPGQSVRDLSWSVQ
jgi:hypothetical protein